jgi:hypothetical protein
MGPEQVLNCIKCSTLQNSCRDSFAGIVAPEGRMSLLSPSCPAPATRFFVDVVAQKFIAYRAPPVYRGKTDKRGNNHRLGFEQHTLGEFSE